MENAECYVRYLISDILVDYSADSKIVGSIRETFSWVGR